MWVLWVRRRRIQVDCGNGGVRRIFWWNPRFPHERQYPQAHRFFFLLLFLFVSRQKKHGVHLWQEDTAMKTRRKRKNPRKRCAICHSWYKPDERTMGHQTCCEKPSCRKERKKRNNKSWQLRHPEYDKFRKLKKRDWAQKEDYWCTYRQEHAVYRAREKLRMQRNRDRVKNVANQDAIGNIFVEKLKSIQRDEPKNVANQVMMSRRINSLIDCLVWRVRVANQAGIELRLPGMR